MACEGQVSLYAIRGLPQPDSQVVMNKRKPLLRVGQACISPVLLRVEYAWQFLILESGVFKPLFVMLQPAL